MSDQNTLNENEFEDGLAKINSALMDLDPEFFNDLDQLQIDNSAIQGLSGFDQSKKNITSSLKEKLTELIDVRHNPVKVISFWILVAAVITALSYISNQRFWNKRTSLFMTSYAELNPQVEEYNPLTESQNFFDNSSIPKNIFILKKMTVNLKPSVFSSSNPMLAFELSIEGITKEVVVELKDREGEFMDLVTRTAEDFTYDELNDSSGKANFSQRILEELNANLTKGQVRKVMYSQFILKN